MKNARTMPLYTMSCSKVPVRMSIEAHSVWSTIARAGTPLVGWRCASHGLITPSSAMAQYTLGPAQVMALTAPAIDTHSSPATKKPLGGPHNAAADFSATGTIGSSASALIERADK